MGVYSGFNQPSMGNTITVTSDYTCVANDNTIKVDTTSNNVTVTIVGANTKPAGSQIRVKKVSTDSNTMTIVAASGNIDGVASFATNSTQKPSYTLETDTVNYIKV